MLSIESMIEEERIPGHWKLERLGGICKTTSGGTPSRKVPEFYNGTIPWVKSGELDNGLILDTEEKITESAVTNSSAKIFPKGTLLIALYGASIGKISFLGIDAATNQAICGIFRSPEINHKFLFYFLSYSRPNLIKQGIGGAQPNISQGILKSLMIPVPPITEQGQIVEKIEELFSELDAARRQLETVKKQIDLYKQAVLKSAFEGGLSKNKIAEYENCYAWKITKIADVGEIVSGGTPSTKEPEYWDGDIPWITPADLSGYSNKYIDKGRRSITSKGLSKSSARIIPSGSVLLSSRAPIGYVAIAKNELCTNQGFKSIIPSSRVTSEYLYYFLKAHTQKIIERASGTTFKEVSLRTISSLEIIIPPIKQQKIIVAEIEHRFSFCDKMEETIFDNIQRSETLKQSILKQAFEGKLVNTQTIQQINCK